MGIPLPEAISESVPGMIYILLSVIYLILLVADFLLAIIPSKIAKRKGYSGAGFYWFGVGCLPAAIIVACVLKNRKAPPEYSQYV